MFCSRCGSEITNDMRFCGNCGAPVNAQAQAPEAAAVSQPTAEPVAGNNIALDRLTKFTRNPLLLLTALVQSVLAVLVAVWIVGSMKNFGEIIEAIFTQNLPFEVGLYYFLQIAANLLSIVASFMVAGGMWMMIVGDKTKLRLIFNGGNLIKAGLWVTDGVMTMMLISYLIQYIKQIEMYSKYGATDSVNKLTTELVVAVVILSFAAVMYSMLSALVAKFSNNLRDVAGGSDPRFLKTGGIGTAVMFVLAAVLLIISAIVAENVMLTDQVRGVMFTLIGMYVLTAVLACMFNGEMKNIKNIYR